MKPEAYERHRQAAAKRQRVESVKGRDIGELPAVQNPERRAAGESSLFNFLDTYFAEVFFLPWSDDHRAVIAELEEKIIHGGLKAYAMERGSGKSAIAERAAIWATIKGLHEFCILIGASGIAAQENIDSIKMELSENEMLLADFPEVCFPIHELQGNPQLCRGQLYKGQRTMIGWRREMIIFPTIPGSKASAAIIKVSSITGRIRGMKFARPDGRIVRPSLALVDDFQTEKSAESPLMCKRRLRTINATILKLAAPGVKMTCFLPCTVIRKGDGADTILNRDISPQWHGHRCKKLYAFPTRMDLWQQYAILRAESQRAGNRGQEATEFYRERQVEMDAGALVAWPQRFEPAHLSALETAMTMFFEDKFSFMAECQNDPIDELAVEGRLTPAELIGRFNGRERRAIPVWASKLTSFIDVQQTVLYWMVVAWRPEDFTGTIIDYGTWPDQRGRRYFTLADVQNTIQVAFPGMGLEAQLLKSLAACQAMLLSRDWRREDGIAVKIDRLLIDSGFQMDEVFEAVRVSPWAGVVMPSRGQPIGAKQKPMHETKTNPGDRKGLHWFIGPQKSGNRVLRWCRIDTNFWKSFLVERLRQALGDPGALTFYGKSRQDADHDMLADHLTCENGIVVEAAGRKITEWTAPPNGQNHFWDCLVGCAVGASVEGATLPGQTSTGPKVKRRISYADMQRQAKERQAR